MTVLGAAFTLTSFLPVFIIISAQHLRVSGFISASNQLGAEREEASNFVIQGAVFDGRV